MNERRGGMAVHNQPEPAIQAAWRARCVEHLRLAVVDAELVLSGTAGLVGRVAPLFAGLESDATDVASVDQFLLIERPGDPRPFSVMNCHGRYAQAARWEQVLPFLLSMVFSQVWDSCPHVVPLHSACVAWQGQGVLFPAVSGGGKTTLALELAQAGFHYFSDEFAPLDRRTGQVRPVARPAQASERTVRGLYGIEADSILATPALRDDDGSLRYLINPTGRAFRHHTVPARYIIQLRMDDVRSDPEIAPWPKAEAFAMLAKSSLVYHADAAWRKDAVRTLAQALLGASCYTLHLGPIGRNAPAVQRLLRDEVWRKAISLSKDELIVEDETVQAIADRAASLVRQEEA